MQGLRAAVKEHLHAIIVITLLTLAMTFPTIVYVFRTDVFALPTTDSTDVFIKLWDIWYGRQILFGKADRFYTDLLYYPAGASLAYHPLFFLHSIVVSALQLLLPLANAYSAAYLISVSSCALAAWVYLRWLFTDKWVALFGAVVFGFSPLAVSIPMQPEIIWIAPLPLVIYFAHRGFRERRSGLIMLAGILGGLTCEVTLYFYVVVLMSIGLVLAAFAAMQWRDRAFWGRAALLMALFALFSAWRILPMLRNSADFDSALSYYGGHEIKIDLLSLVFSRGNPILGSVFDAMLQSADAVNLSSISYLGVLPVMLVAAGLAKRRLRPRMLPWLGFGLAFLLPSLGSTLTINGIEYAGLKLPKHYLNQLAPTIFESFVHPTFFMPGVYLALAVLACFGLQALNDRPRARPAFILLLVAVVAFEYYSPIRMQFIDEITGNPLTEERLAFVDWLKREEMEEIGLINLPFGRDNAKVYLFYQSLTGFPQTEGGISRPPDSLYDYFRSNPVMNIWLEQRPTNCVIQDRVKYLEGLTELAEDGFTHVIHHYGFYFWQRHFESFRYVEPSYSDAYVSIYRLRDMLESCPR
ncbi:MAG: hypothetical protein OXN88_16720 [Chloroflexota bacterium]|nr:hypothetical protein [Chloroflexota bacterium]